MYKEVLYLDSLDINKVISAISKMNKEELEKNICKAKQILENSNLNLENKEDN